MSKDIKYYNEKWYILFDEMYNKIDDGDYEAAAEITKEMNKIASIIMELENGKK
jgi:hypothetical protein